MPKLARPSKKRVPRKRKVSARRRRSCEVSKNPKGVRCKKRNKAQALADLLKDITKYIRAARKISLVENLARRLRKYGIELDVDTIAWKVGWDEKRKLIVIVSHDTSGRPIPGFTFMPINVWIGQYLYAERIGIDGSWFREQHPEPKLIPGRPIQWAKELAKRQFFDRDYYTLSLVYWRGDFYRFSYDTRTWIKQDITTIRHEAQMFLTKAHEATEGVTGSKRNTDELMEALKGLCSLESRMSPPFYVYSAEVDHRGDERPGLENHIDLANGTLDLDTRTLGESNPAMFFLYASEVAYDPDAPTPHRWLSFLDQLWPNDPEAIRCLQQWFGYCLTSDTRLQKILMIVGPKRSGKGTIAKILSTLIGLQNSAAPTLHSLTQNFGLAPVVSMLVAIICDARLSGQSNMAAVTERLLTISGGDAVTIDIKHKPATTVIPTVRLMFLSNETPRFNDASGALASRFITLSLSESFYGKEDLDLFANLCKELPGILLWALDGLRDLRETGRLIQPRSGARVTEELEVLSSPVAAYVDERCIVEPDADVTCLVLYEDFRRFQCERGHKYIPSASVFGRDLHSAAPSIQVKQRRIGDIRERYYVGIGLPKARIHGRRRRRH